MIIFPPDHFLGAQRNGTNHVQMNVSIFDRVAGPERGVNYPLFSDALLDWYKAKQMKMIRLLFNWEAVQSTAFGPVPSAAGVGYGNYWSDLTDVLRRLLARGFYVVLGVYQYNPASNDTDIVYQGDAFTAAQFADFWGKMAAAINALTGNDQRVAFELINEPHEKVSPQDVGITLAGWFACAQAAIDAIRAAGAANTVLVPGMNYTAAAFFTINGSTDAYLGLNDPLKNMAVTVHLYTGLDSPDPKVLSADCSALVSWARAKDVKVVVGEVALDAGNNGLPPFCGDLATAQAQWEDWNKFCIANADVLVGWTWWGNSAPVPWWDQGDHCNGSHWGLTLDDGATQTLYMDLIEPTLPTPSPVVAKRVENAIFFLNASTGDGAVSLLDAAGNYTPAGSIPGLALGWTHVRGAANGGLLFYNSWTGAGATARLDGAGAYAFVGALAGLSRGWTHIVAACEGSLLFYNADTGKGATATLDAAGNYALVAAIPGFDTGWTHITGAANGGLLFYNARTGKGATATLDNAGNYAFVGALSGFSEGFTHVVAASEGSLLFYNSYSGDGATARLDAGGKYAYVGALRSLERGWTHVGGTPGGTLLFYNAATGDAAVSTLDAAGKCSFVGAMAGLPQGWSQVIGL